MSIDSISNSYGSYSDYTEMQKNLFKKMDANTDGKVSAEEFSAAKPEDVSDEQSSVMFTFIDTDKDGNISESEMTSTPPPPPQGSGKPEGDPRGFAFPEDQITDTQSEY